MAVLFVLLSNFRKFLFITPILNIISISSSLNDSLIRAIVHAMLFKVSSSSQLKPNVRTGSILVARDDLIQGFPRDKLDTTHDLN